MNTSRWHKRIRIAIATLILLLAATSAGAGPLGGGAQRFAPTQLRIFGYVGVRPEGVPPLTTWVITVNGKNYTFICERIDVLIGNLSYMNVVEALAPYNPAFRLNGTKTVLHEFTTAAPKQRIAMLGVLRFGGGARIFMVDSIESTPPITPAL